MKAFSRSKGRCLRWLTAFLDTLPPTVNMRDLDFNLVLGSSMQEQNPRVVLYHVFLMLSSKQSCKTN